MNPNSTKGKEETSAVKGLIFDMDGTVISSIELDFDAWNKALQTYEVEVAYEDYMKDLGAKGEKIVCKYVDLSEEEAKTFTQQKDEYFEKNVQEHGLESMPFIEPILKDAKEKGLKIALATGSKNQKLDLVFDHVNLRHYFDAIITADDVEEGKPAGEPFLKAAEKLGLQPEEVIVWEDATLGVQAAKNAGMKCVCITTTQKGNIDGLEGADILIHSYEGLNLQDLLDHKQTV